MRTFEILIQGTTPMLQHRFTEESEVEKQTRRVARAETDPRKEAERVAYRLPSGDLYMPGAAIARLLREAGGGHKQKGSRKSMKYVVPAAILVNEDMIPLVNGDGKTALVDFEVDSRPVTIPATKGRIMRHRPRLNQWGARFTLRINPQLIDPQFVHQLLNEGGQQLGLLDYRPERGGPFGTFNVVEWREIGADGEEVKPAEPAKKKKNAA